MGAWLVYVGVALLLALAGTLATKGGRKALVRQRRRAAKWARGVSRQAWRARRMSTPRGRMRQARREQPYRLTVGHRRPEGDPSLAARTGHAIAGEVRRDVEKARLAWANRDRPNLRLVRSERREGSMGLCGSTKTVDGHACRNPRMIGAARCWEHQSSWLA